MGRSGDGQSHLAGMWSGHMWDKAVGAAVKNGPVRPSISGHQPATLACLCHNPLHRFLMSPLAEGILAISKPIGPWTTCDLSPTPPG